MKKVLLIAGGGTLGRYTAKELLKLGCLVDTICLNDYKSEDANQRFIKANADHEFLESFLKKNKYDGIVNFIHYINVEDYKKVYKLMSENAEHIIFLSSYRVYADLQHPVTESAPRLYDTVTDKNFLEKEYYAVPKSICENFLVNEAEHKNWTIVRPVISFSDRRLDIVNVSGRRVIEHAKENRPILLPEKSRKLTAGLDWAGNSGKLIAHLLFKQDALGEAFTISTAQNITWEEVAECYNEILGVSFQWVDNESFLDANPNVKNDSWSFYYDRLYDRKIDNSKVLKVTGLKNEDFVSIKDAIKIEIDIVKKEEAQIGGFRKII